jgi:hypothetical protein
MFKCGFCWCWRTASVQEQAGAAGEKKHSSHPALVAGPFASGLFKKPDASLLQESYREVSGKICETGNP